MAHDHAKTLQQVEQELKLAGYSPRTVSSYLGVASRFLRFVDKPARRIGRDDIRRYFVELTERKQAASSINQAHFGVRFLIRDVLKKQWRQPLRLHKRPQRVPIVHSRAEASTLLSVTESLRFRTIWMALRAAVSRGTMSYGRMTRSSAAKPKETTTMRINARLDDSRARKLTYLARATSQATTEIVKRAIDLYYEQETATRQSAAEVLRSVGFVGSGRASPELSTDYKSELQAILAEKHDHR